jgi:peptide/nickel transport system permease protein
MIRILPTDAFVFLLVAAGVLFIAYARRREYWRTAWQQVRRNSVACMSLIVLSGYVSIALLDTIHYVDRQSGATLSALDWIAAPLRLQVEKTYSAPFARYQFSREFAETGAGSLRRGYPRLRYGGAHLADAQSALPDLCRRLLKALVQGAVVGCLLGCIGLCGSSLLSRMKFPRGGHARFTMPSRKTLVTTLLLTCVASTVIAVLINVAPYYHLLGTDKVGSDVFYRSLKSIRTGLVIGSVTTLIVIPFALMFGVIAGYYGGIADDIIQYVYSIFASIPSVLLIVSVMLLIEVGETVGDMAWKADRRLLSLCVIMGLTTWTGLCRLIRGETLKLRELDYVQAALSFGVSRPRILVRHIIPNLMHIVLISFVLRFSGLVLAEAVLAYIGIGVDPSMESWGNMINTARLELAREPVVWWNLFSALVFMFGLVLPANLFGDALRDALDPRLKS